ncbi:MAG: DNA-processing protein DprA [Betaproteobacteria bacterium]
MSEGRVQSWIRLSLVKGIGPRGTHALLSNFGSPAAILDAPLSALEQHVPGAAARAIKSAGDRALVDRILEWSRGPGNHLLAWDDADYPKMLLDTADAPPLLYFKGRRELLNAPAIAIVGSRNASPSGLRTAEEFAEALACAGLTIVSGLAQGIDAAAHRGGLRAGPRGASTIAVIGTGVDRVYPPSNRDLAHQIAGEGGILTDFVLGTPPVAANFPKRNALISGLARGVLVVEAALGSGSLITARLAGEQGRDVFAIPGSIHSPFSKGCHKLIKDGAKLVETARDILEELRWPLSGVAATSTQPASAQTDEKAQTLLLALAFDPLTTDELCARLGWPVGAVSALLVELELAGKVAQTPGGRVQRLG